MSTGLGGFWEQMEQEDQELVKKIAERKAKIVAEANAKNSVIESKEDENDADSG